MSQGGCSEIVFLAGFRKSAPGLQRFFQFEIIIDVSVITFRFIRIPMLCAHGDYKYVYSSSAGIDSGRLQNVTSTEIKF